jgi:hypothetical protein
MCRCILCQHLRVCVHACTSVSVSFSLSVSLRVQLGQTDAMCEGTVHIPAFAAFAQVGGKRTV